MTQEQEWREIRRTSTAVIYAYGYFDLIEIAHAAPYWAHVTNNHRFGRDVRGGPFYSFDDALQWGRETSRELQLEVACESLSLAFEDMAEWLPRVAPFVDSLRAEAQAAAYEACAVMADKAATTKNEALEYVSSYDPRFREIVAARDALRDLATTLKVRVQELKQ